MCIRDIFFLNIIELVDNSLVQQQGDPTSPVFVHDLIVDYLKSTIPKDKQVKARQRLRTLPFHTSQANYLYTVLFSIGCSASV